MSNRQEIGFILVLMMTFIIFTSGCGGGSSGGGATPENTNSESIPEGSWSDPIGSQGGSCFFQDLGLLIEISENTVHTEEIS